MVPLAYEDVVDLLVVFVVIVLLASNGSVFLSGFKFLSTTGGGAPSVVEAVSSEGEVGEFALREPEDTSVPRAAADLESISDILQYTAPAELGGECSEEQVEDESSVSSVSHGVRGDFR